MPEHRKSAPAKARALGSDARLGYAMVKAAAAGGAAGCGVDSPTWPGFTPWKAPGPVVKEYWSPPFTFMAVAV